MNALKKIVGSNNFSAQFIKFLTIRRLVIALMYACLVVDPITVGNFAFLFNCMTSGQTSYSVTVPT